MSPPKLNHESALQQLPFFSEPWLLLYSLSTNFSLSMISCWCQESRVSIIGYLICSACLQVSSLDSWISSFICHCI